MQVSQSVAKDFPDLNLPVGLRTFAGLLCIPLSGAGKDFLVFMRRGQLQNVRWAGKPYKEGMETGSALEPRKSFKVTD